MILLVLLLVVYLTSRYDYTGGYFRGAESELDRWLVASYKSFVFLLVVASTSIIARSPDLNSRLLPALGLLLSFILAVGFRSRTFMLLTLQLTALCWLTMRRGQISYRFLLVTGLMAVILFSAGSTVKNFQQESTSIWDNIQVVQSTGANEALENTSVNVQRDKEYRTSGFEYPAAILYCLNSGASPAYGDGIVGAALQGLPGFLRPAGFYAERGAIARNYWDNNCYFYDDSMAIPLASGLGDWGVLGMFIYIFFGIFSVFLWRFVQFSPRLFIVYLIIPFYPDYLFWDGISNLVKFGVFLFVLLWLLGPVLMPKWKLQSDAKHESCLT
jgi:hypothetical protein